MIETPQIVNSDEQPTAVIRLTVPLAGIEEAMGAAIFEVMATLSTQGIATVGSCFTYHFRRPTDTFDFEVGFPVSAAVTPSGRVKPGRLPAARVARTVYCGGYEGLGEAWGELYRWIEGQGLTPQESLWERYVTGPEASPNPEEWRTELNAPLK